MDEKNLTNLKYIDSSVYNIKNNPDKYLLEQAEFKKFMNEKNIELGNVNFTTSSKKLNNVVEQSENVIDLLDARNNLIESGQMLNSSLSKQDFIRSNSIRYDTLNNQADSSLALQLQSQQAGPNDRFVQERRRWLNVDSRDRDLTLYPDQNDYKVELNKEIFTNVISVKLKSSEFINTQQLIRDTPVSQRNNIIQWNIDGDFSSGANLVVYTATLTPGNYNETTLAAEIERAMNSVPRSGTGATQGFNNFDVSIDTVTDIVEFTSISFTTFTDPFTVAIPAPTENFTKVTVSDPGHSAKSSGFFVVGDRIFVENSVAVGGIAAGLLNTEHVITEVPDVNSYVFQVVGTATSNDTGGGTVRIGTGVEFQLLFSEENSPASILGFAEEDTGFSTVIQNTKEIFNYGNDTDADTDRRLKINYMVPSDAGNTTEIRTTQPHLLSTGDRVFIYNSGSAPIGVIDYDHEYGVNPLNTTEQNIRDLFLSQITDPAGLIITVNGSNTFTVPIDYGNYITDAGGNPNIEDYILANIDDDDAFGDVVLKQINAAIDFTGEKYIYMISRTLGGDFATTTDGIENVFAKIQLAGNATSAIYNSFIGGIKIFYDAPLNELNELDFQFVTADGELFEFNDRNHSFTLEITEAIQKLEGTNYSARIGARN
jgi:hypothetical protein